VKAALLLLITGLIVHYAWEYADHVLAAEAWNVGGAFGRLVLLSLLCLAWQGRKGAWAVFLVTLWWVFEESQVIACGVWWMLTRWPTEVGEPRCSAWLGIPMGLMGLALASILVAALIRRSRDG
jgi:hypothetical protein